MSDTMPTPEEEAARIAAARDQRMAELAEGATEMMNLYVAYTSVGFTPEQTMQILMTVLREGLRSGD